jgi:hypothetical protein
VFESNNKAGGIQRKDPMNQTLMIIDKGMDELNIDLPLSVTNASGRNALNLNSTVKFDSEFGSRTGAFGQGRASPLLTKLP